MTHREDIIPIEKLNLKLNFAIMVIHIYFLKEIAGESKGRTDAKLVAAWQTGNRERKKEVAFKNGVLYISSTSEINNTQIDDAKYIDVVMLMSNLRD